MQHNYFIYILTNKNKKVLYVGLTNDLRTRLKQHYEDSIGPIKTFAGKYNCYSLVYWERHQWVQHAIEREKEIKGWKRNKKDALISEFNPEREFLNDKIY
ncbi:MAG: GIY-YIG nuclease family protein [Cyclobacteriaceae bacterium]